MAVILVDIEDIELEGDYGEIPSIQVTCTRCGHAVEVYGRSIRSCKRGAIMLKEECPEGGSNYYTVSEDDQLERDD